MENNVGRLKKGLKLVRDELYRDLPIQYLLMFLVVADNPGITMTELSDELEIPQGTVSRSVKALSKYLRNPTEAEIARGENQKKEAGHGLLRVTPDLHNRKTYAVFLTAKGHEFLRDLMVAVYV